MSEQKTKWHWSVKFFDVREIMQNKSSLNAFLEQVNNNENAEIINIMGLTVDNKSSIAVVYAEKNTTKDDLKKEVRFMDSRKVAEMLGMDHSALLKKLDNISEKFTEAKKSLVKYWEESSYIDELGKKNKCYLITRLGCRFLSNQMPEEKKFLFTVAYATEFNKMERKGEK